MFDYRRVCPLTWQFIDNLWKKQKNRGELGRHSEITRVGVLLAMLAHVGRCWQMLADVGMFDFEFKLAKNELGRWLPHDDLVVFQEEKQLYLNEQCSKPLLVDVVSFFLVGVGLYDPIYWR